MFNGIIDDFLVVILDRSYLLQPECPYKEPGIDISAGQKNKKTDTERDDIDDISPAYRYRSHQSIILIRIILGHVINIESPALERGKISICIGVEMYGGIKHNGNQIKDPYSPSLTDIINVKYAL